MPFEELPLISLAETQISIKRLAAVLKSSFHGLIKLIKTVCKIYVCVFWGRRTGEELKEGKGSPVHSSLLSLMIPSISHYETIFTLSSVAFAGVFQPELFSGLWITRPACICRSGRLRSPLAISGRVFPISCELASKAGARASKGRLFTGKGLAPAQISTGLSVAWGHRQRGCWQAVLP